MITTAIMVDGASYTFAEVYERYFADKYLSGSKRVFSQSTISSTKTAYHNCSALYEREFCSLRYEDDYGVLRDPQPGGSSPWYKSCTASVQYRYVPEADAWTRF